MGSNQDIIAKVVTAIEQTRIEDFAECQYEFDASCEYLAKSFEASKRKLLDLGLITDESWLKRFKQIGRDRNQESYDIHTIAHPEESTYQNVIDEAILEEEEEDQELEIDVASLKVSELRLHLKERGLDQFGLKKDLQKRLQDSIDEENAVDESSHQQNSPHDRDSVRDIEMTETQNDLVNLEENIQMKSTDIMTDVKVEHNTKALDEKKFVIKAESLPDVDDGSDESSTESDAEEMESDDVKKNDAVVGSSISLTDTASYGLGHFIMKAASKIFSPGTKPQQAKLHSPKLDLTATEQTIDASPPRAKVTKSPSSNSTNSPSRKRMSMVCDMSLEEIKSVKKTEEILNTDDQIKSIRTSSNESTSSIPSIQIKVAGGTNSISKSNAEKMEAIREARAARLQQIRNKVNQIPVASAIKSATTTSSILQSKLKSSGANPEEERKRAIAEKMRQKALTVQTSNKIASSVLMNPVVVSTPLDNKKDQDSIKTKTEAKKVLSPMDTYQMSDREESESESSENENEEPANRKPIASWAQRQNLLPALQAQFIDGPNKIDPDKIFHDIFTCDLEEIFGKKKSKYQDRRSTGNWTRDKVTLQERDAYSRQMGFK